MNSLAPRLGMRFLTIAISTNKLDIDSLLSRLLGYEEIFDSQVQFLVVHQVAGDAKRYSVGESIDVVETRSTGLSRSRNEAIRFSTTDWIWFQDDDIKIVEDKELLQDFLKHLGEKVDFDIFMIRIKSLEEPDIFYKNYNFSGFRTHLVALKVSSIEIIVKRDFLLRNDLRFDPALGLGTDMPGGEDPLFVYDCLKKGANIYFSTFSLCYHTTQDDLRNSDFRAKYIAQGYLLAKLGHWAAPLLFIRWAVRKCPGVSFPESLSLLLSGFIKGIKS